MEWRRGPGRRREGLAVDRLVAETEAFLAGRYLEVVTASGTGSPAWAQLNWLAHADPGDVRNSRRPGPNRPARLGSWPWAVEVLATELLASTSDDTGVRILQRECLVPLELTIMLPSFWNVMPAEVVTLALTRLRAHPRARGRGPTRVPPPDGS